MAYGWEDFTLKDPKIVIKSLNNIAVPVAIWLNYKA